MKNLVVYYSWTGNTEVAAKELHKLVGGELVKLEEIKERKMRIGFAGAAFSAVLGMKSRLKSVNFNVKDYDNVFIGSPVWASRCTPAINTFLSKAGLNGKKVFLFVTLADDKIPTKVFSFLEKKVEKRGGKVVDSISIMTCMNSVIEPESARSLLSQWIKKPGL